MYHLQLVDRLLKRHQLNLPISLNQNDKTVCRPIPNRYHLKRHQLNSPTSLNQNDKTVCRPIPNRYHLKLYWRARYQLNAIIFYGLTSPTPKQSITNRVNSNPSSTRTLLAFRVDNTKQTSHYERQPIYKRTL